jgi:hypothetical protein
MNDFSITTASNKIYFSKTKKYYEEVIKSYLSKNFRSAIVMLYSVLICDIIYKLQELEDRFSDENAKKILSEILILQKNKPNSPEWEKKLIELVKERTDLLKASDYVNVIMLQKHRNLSSHPVFEDNYELYSPNEETALAHIRNITEGILINPPLFTKKIISTLLIDLENVSNVFLNEDDEALDSYLNSKYLKHMSEATLKSVFKSFWKIVYIIENEQSSKNRIINSKAIRFFYRKNKELLLKYIKSEIIYFSDLNPRHNMYFLVGLLSQHQEIYHILNENAKIIIKQACKEDNINKSMAWFLFPNLKAHSDWIKQKDQENVFKSIHLNTIKAFYQAYIEAGMQQELYDLLICLFNDSQSESMSINRYSFITFILPKINRENIINIITAVESNKFNQSLNIKMIKQYSDQILGNDFKYSNYPQFENSLKRLV